MNLSLRKFALAASCMLFAGQLLRSPNPNARNASPRPRPAVVST